MFKLIETADETETTAKETIFPNYGALERHLRESGHFNAGTPRAWAIVPADEDGQFDEKLVEDLKKAIVID